MLLSSFRLQSQPGLGIAASEKVRNPVDERLLGFLSLCVAIGVRKPSQRLFPSKYSVEFLPLQSVRLRQLVIGVGRGVEIEHNLFIGGGVTPETTTRTRCSRDEMLHVDVFVSLVACHPRMFEDLGHRESLFAVYFEQSTDKVYGLA